MGGSTSGGLQPVAFTDVRIGGRFWAPRLEVNRTATLPHEYEQCEQTGRVDGFRLQWRPGVEPKPHFFWDSDLAKWIEAASYSLGTHSDPELATLLDRAVALIVSAQQPDGYLNVYFTVVEPEGRWADTRDAHELYCAGHLIEAGVAHFLGTGKRTLLDAVCRYADHIGRVFGRGPGQKPGYCGHEEIELALVRLWRATGEERYLNLARYFVDQRGQTPNWFEVERSSRGTPGHAEGFMGGMKHMPRYNQSHAPVSDQPEAVGHSVRAMYLYSAMADLALALHDNRLREACERLWADVTGRKMYVTGGVGSSAANEGFTSAYDLPNETAYAETCANVGLVFWAHRMLHLDCDRGYADVMERALFNAVVSGVSLDGRRFFYANPLASLGGAQRSDWFGCACCPPNVARLLASLGTYAYSTSEDELAVHLYLESQARVRVAGREVTVRQETDYPWDGRVTVRLEMSSPTAFALRVRVPAWCRRPSVRVNGAAADLGRATERGYARIERMWRDGDVLELDLPMPVERVHAHPAVAADLGRVALQRGPVVYCFESVDHPGLPLHRVFIPGDVDWEASFATGLLGGIVTLRGEGFLESEGAYGVGEIYRAEAPVRRRVALMAVPYCVWDNRAPGQMQVWMLDGGSGNTPSA